MLAIERFKRVLTLELRIFEPMFREIYRIKPLCLYVLNLPIPDQSLKLRIHTSKPVPTVLFFYKLEASRFKNL